ncbi:MAG: signal recognition particle-docking protein FtsY [Bauldia sp.]|nr:signal recognition particle-docking protein FtsY [Bauldia sp.]
MAEEKRGLFRRMFSGGAAPAAEPLEPPIAPEVELPLATEMPPPFARDTLDAEPLPQPPDDLTAAGEPHASPEPPGAEAERIGWLGRLRRGLTRSSSALSGSISSIFTRRKLDGAILEEFEEALIRADLGVDVAAAITRALAKERFGKELSDEDVKAILASEVEKVLAPVARPLVIADRKPEVILVVGVNGTGKTTTIGKLSAKYRAEGRSVILAAGDTFRAAAIDQLKIWGSRTGSKVIAREAGSDAASLGFEALREAKADGADVLIIDTAGRLQNRAELMAELEKVIRVIRKQDPSAPHHVILTLDATTGQNAISQVEIFRRTAGVTGLVMTKLDGTARGGILVALSSRFGLPVHFIGVGEGVDDLEPFAARDFARAIAGL